LQERGKEKRKKRSDSFKVSCRGNTLWTRSALLLSQSVPEYLRGIFKRCSNLGGKGVGRKVLCFPNSMSTEAGGNKNWVFSFLFCFDFLFCF
jgi:hypothetical protein